MCEATTSDLKMKTIFFCQVRTRPVVLSVLSVNTQSDRVLRFITAAVAKSQLQDVGVQTDCEEVGWFVLI